MFGESVQREREREFRGSFKERSGGNSTIFEKTFKEQDRRLLACALVVAKWRAVDKVIFKFRISFKVITPSNLCEVA